MEFRGQPNPFGQPVFYGVPGVPVGEEGERANAPDVRWSRARLETGILYVRIYVRGDEMLTFKRRGMFIFFSPSRLKACGGWAGSGRKLTA